MPIGREPFRSALWQRWSHVANAIRNVRTRARFGRAEVARAMQARKLRRAQE